jgi:hypothetical protein
MLSGPPCQGSLAPRVRARPDGHRSGNSPAAPKPGLGGWQLFVPKPPLGCPPDARTGQVPSGPADLGSRGRGLCPFHTSAYAYPPNPWRPREAK